MAPSLSCSSSRGRGTGSSRSQGRLSLVHMCGVASDTVAITFLSVGIIPYLGRTQQVVPSTPSGHASPLRLCTRPILQTKMNLAAALLAGIVLAKPADIKTQ